MAILIDRIKVLEEMLGIMFKQRQESGYYDDMIEIGAMRYSDVEYENGKSDGMDIAYNLIADAPEVKAIPIEWLREYCKYNHTPDGMDWHIAIDLIIKRWEKENENI